MHIDAFVDDKKFKSSFRLKELIDDFIILYEFGNHIEQTQKLKANSYALYPKSLFNLGDCSILLTPEKTHVRRMSGCIYHHRTGWYRLSTDWRDCLEKRMDAITRHLNNVSFKASLEGGVVLDVKRDFRGCDQ